MNTCAIYEHFYCKWGLSSVRFYLPSKLEDKTGDILLSAEHNYYLMNKARSWWFYIHRLCFSILSKDVWLELHFFMQLWEETIAFTKDLQWVVSIFHVFYFIEGVEPEFTISLQNSNLETSEANCQTWKWKTTQYVIVGMIRTLRHVESAPPARRRESSLH